MTVFNANNIPFELKILNQWVLWNYEPINGGKIKVPYQPSGEKASTTNPKTWSIFEEVCEVADNFRGIGFVFTEESGIIGLAYGYVKYGDKRDSEALQEVQSLNSYAEFSPNGRRINMYVRGKIPGIRKMMGTLEICNKGRFFDVTGEHLSGTPNRINEAQEAVNALYMKRWHSGR